MSVIDRPELANYSTIATTREQIADARHVYVATELSHATGLSWIRVSKTHASKIIRDLAQHKNDAMLLVAAEEVEVVVDVLDKAHDFDLYLGF